MPALSLQEIVNACFFVSFLHADVLFGLELQIATSHSMLDLLIFFLLLMWHSTSSLKLVRKHRSVLFVQDQTKFDLEYELWYFQMVFRIEQPNYAYTHSVHMAMVYFTWSNVAFSVFKVTKPRETKKREQPSCVMTQLSTQ